MKRFLWLALVLGVLAPKGFAQTQYLRQSTATQVQIVAIGLVSGDFLTVTGSMPVINIALTKGADTGVPSVTTWTATAFGGGTHDCYVGAVGAQEWTCELTATDTNTLGRLDLCWSYSTTAVRDCDRYTVLAQASYDASIAGNLASYSDVATIKANTDAIGTIEKNVASQQLGIWFKSASGGNVTGLSTANITCVISKDFGAFATTNDTTEAEVGNGVYVIDLTQAETNANWLALNCTDATAAALPYSALITTQH